VATVLLAVSVAGRLLVTVPVSPRGQRQRLGATLEHAMSSSRDDLSGAKMS